MTLRRLPMTCLLIVAALFAGYWLEAGALMPSQSDGELSVQTPAKIVVSPGEPARMTLTGTGLDHGTRVWLAPEETLRCGLAATCSTLGNPLHLLQVGDRAYVANGRGGVLCFDLHDWARPRLLGGFKLSRLALELAGDSNLLFVAAAQSGLMVVDFSNPQAPVAIADLPLPGPALALTLQGDRLFIAAGSAGLLVIDVSRPRQPRLVARATTTDVAIDVAVTGCCVYLACGSGGIERFDISDPSNPVPLAALHPPGAVRCLAGQGTMLYAGSRFTGPSTSAFLSVFDGSEHRAPVRRSLHSIDGDPVSIQIQNQQLTLSLGYNGVSRFDLAEPGAPRPLDSLGDIGPIRSTLSNGDWIMLADSSGAIRTLRLSERLQLPKISLLHNRSLNGTPLLQDNLLLLPLRNEYLQIYAADDPTRPQWLADFKLPQNVDSLALHGSQLIVTTNEFDHPSRPQKGHLLVVSLDDPGRPEIRSQLQLPAGPTGLALHENLAVVVMTILQQARPLAPDHYSGRLAVFRLKAGGEVEALHQIELEQTPTGVVMRNGYAIVSFAEGVVKTFRISADAEPVQSGEVALSWLYQGSKTPSGGIVLQRGIAAVYNGSPELNFIDVDNPTQPLLLGSGELPGIIDQLAIDGSLLYVGVVSRGIMLYDLAIPRRPRQLGLLALPRSGNSFAVGEDFLWVGGSTKQGMTCIPKPQLVEIDAARDGHELALRLPSPRAAGDYALWVERDNRWQEIPNAVRFSTR